MWTKDNLVNMRETPSGMEIDHLKDASALDLMRADMERLPATSEYLEYQHRDNSWSHNGDWGSNAVRNAERYLRLLKMYRGGIHYEDDIFCDFGGNDGTVAEAWRRATGNEVISVDLDSLKQGWGKNSYPGVTFVNAVLEDIPLPDKSIDWAFCSHTLEHVADLPAAIASIERITRRGAFFVVPLENEKSFRESMPHMRASNDPLDWLAHFRHPAMRLVNWGKPLNIGAEMCAFYAMDGIGADTTQMDEYWLGEAS